MKLEGSLKTIFGASAKDLRRILSEETITEALKDTVTATSKHIEDDQILSLLSRFADQIPERFQHCCRTAIMATAFQQKTVYLSPSSLEPLILAALIHDIGFLWLGPAMQMKSRKLVKENELTDFEMHVHHGVEALLQLMEIPENLERIVREHHEYADGSGFPAKKSANELLPESKILVLCNEFDNSSFLENRSLSMPDILKLMKTVKSHQFHKDDLDAFLAFLENRSS